MSMFNVIEKQNGKQFADSIQDYDNGIFNIPNLDKIVKYAGQDAKPILLYLESIKKSCIDEQFAKKSPFELLQSAGYKAVYANSPETQNYIQKYFKKSEELGIFKKNDKYKDYHIINAVNDEAERLNRADFSNPQPYDKYGLSVLSIQIDKSNNYIYINNRYGNTIKFADNIIPGLLASLHKYFNITMRNNANLLPSERFKTVNGQIVKFNYDLYGILSGPDFWVYNNQIQDINKETQFIADYFLFDTNTKQFQNIENIACNKFNIPCDLAFKDSFINVINKEIKGKDLRMQRNEIDDTVTLFANSVPVVTTQKGLIVALNLPDTKEIGPVFLQNNEVLSSFNADNLEFVDDGFLCRNVGLTTLHLGNLKKVGNDFIVQNENIHDFQANKLQKVGYNFLASNKKIKQLELNELQSADNTFLYCNKCLKYLRVDKLESFGNDALFYNESLDVLYVPRLKNIKNNFMYKNKILYKFYAPNLQSYGENFLKNNNKISKKTVMNTTQSALNAKSQNAQEISQNTVNGLDLKNYYKKLFQITEKINLAKFLHKGKPRTR